MSRAALRGSLYVLLALLFFLRYDFWLWDDARFWLGLPVGLTYHVLVCLIAAGLIALLVRFAWPAGLDDEDGDRT